MDFPTKIRSDYHHLTYSTPPSSDFFRRFFQPSFLILLGFVMGLFVTNLLFHKENQQIAFTENHPTVAMRQVSDVVIEEYSSTANA